MGAGTARAVGLRPNAAHDRGKEPAGARRRGLNWKCTTKVRRTADTREFIERSVGVQTGAEGVLDSRASDNDPVDAKTAAAVVGDRVKEMACARVVLELEVQRQYFTLREPQSPEGRADVERPPGRVGSQAAGVSCARSHHLSVLDVLSLG